MKKIIFFLFIFNFLFGQEEGIKFEHGSWSEVLQKAKKENKTIMLDAYASWCGPCKWMAKNIFPKKEVGDFYNANFINVKLDMEKGEGVKLAQKYGVMAYPTFYFIDSKGNVIHQVCGGQEAEEFINSGKAAMDADLRLSTLESKFNKASNDSKVAMEYFNAAEKGCVDVEPKVRKYMEGISPVEYLQENNFQLIERFITDYNHITLKKVFNSYDEFASALGKERIDNKIRNIYASAIQFACNRKDEAELKAVKASYQSQQKAPNVWLNDFSDMLWYESMNDSVAYFPAAIKFCDSYMTNDWQQLNSMAWTFYERTSNAKYLEKATEWIVKSISLEKNYANTDTYAALLFKRGDYVNAKSVAEEAIGLGKSAGEDVKSTESLLEQINNQLKNKK
ncbi:MAG: thioredoxin family protein [Bacteroidota bacterium]|jgi:thioredoxin-related protein